MFLIIDRFFYTAKYDHWLGRGVEKFIFPLWGVGHDHTAQYKIFGWASGPFKMIFFGNFSKVLVVRMLKFSGRIYIYYNIYLVYINHLEVVCAADSRAVENFIGLFSTRKVVEKFIRNRLVGIVRNFFLGVCEINRSLGVESSWYFAI